MAVGALATIHAADLQLAVAPAFSENFVSGNGTVPIICDLQNNGPDAKGVLVVGTEGNSVQIPVDLPQGAQKRYFAYVTWDYSNLDVTLATNRGALRKQLEPKFNGNPGKTNVLSISDLPGQLSLLRGKTESLIFNGTDCAVENAPPRMAGYRAVRVIVLGEGSERLSDAQVDALQMWTLRGGTLIFTGGASSLVLDDPRWTPYLPVRNSRVTTRPVGPWLGSVDRRGIPSVLTLREGQRIAGSKNLDTPLITVRPFGIGRIVQMAVNPFDESVRAWQGRVGLVVRSMRYAQSGQSSQFLANDPDPNMAGGWSGGRMESSSAFQIELPKTSKIVWILIAYFVCVVPLNFLILRKMKRAELAWVTAPILALGFAGVLLGSAKALYSAGLSTATQGVLLLQQGVPDAMFEGSAQIFFPNGGQYDLKLESADYVSSLSQGRGVMFGGMANQVQVVETGDQMNVPALSATNLSFEEILLSRRVNQAGGWVEVERMGFAVKVTNRSPYEMQQVTVSSPTRYSGLFGLKPGETKTVGLPHAFVAPKPGFPNSRGFRSVSGAFVQGNLVGSRFGPQLGEETPGNSVRFAFQSQVDVP
ncbi:MAG: hypothetical protein ACOYON_07975 [Fimbriimonas sp.]